MRETPTPTTPAYAPRTDPTLVTVATCFTCLQMACTCGPSRYTIPVDVSAQNPNRSPALPRGRNADGSMAPDPTTKPERYRLERRSADNVIVARLIGSGGQRRRFTVADWMDLASDDDFDVYLRTGSVPANATRPAR